MFRPKIKEKKDKKQTQSVFTFICKIFLKFNYCKYSILNLPKGPMKYKYDPTIQLHPNLEIRRQSSFQKNKKKLEGKVKRVVVATSSYVFEWTHFEEFSQFLGAIMDN